MNRAAARMMARDPRISASGLRFLLMANIIAREFCAGFRMRTCGECLALSTPSAQRLPVARKSRIHGGRGDFFSTRYGRIMLTYVNRRPKRTPYRRPKGTPFVERCDGYGGRAVRAGCGVGRA